MSEPVEHRRPENIREWTDAHWRAFHAERFIALEPKMRDAAVAFLALTFEREGCVAELQARIDENPGRWIGGRKAVPCVYCRRGSIDQPPEKGCIMCNGSGICDEMPLHHGWGTGIRNLLRQNGFSEKHLGVSNLDDYYVGLVEAAVGRSPAQ